MPTELAKAITTLPKREAIVLSLYYDEELNLREIGEVLSVSESRVSQIHSQAMLKLKAKLRSWHAEEAKTSDVIKRIIQWTQTSKF